MMHYREGADPSGSSDAQPPDAALEQRVAERTAHLEQAMAVQERYAALLRTQYALLDLARDAILVRELDGRIIFWNDGATRLYGWTRQEALGQASRALLGTVFPDSLAAVLATLRQTGAWEGELVHTTRTGARVTVLSRWALERDATGAPRAALEINTDITARKATEAALLASEARFRDLLEAAPDAIVTVDPAGRMVLVNAQTERLFGYDRDALLGQPVEHLLPARFRAAHQRHRENYAADPRPRPMGAGLTLVGRRQDGSEFPVEISLSPLARAEGPLVIASIRDVTVSQVATRQLRATAAELARSNRDLEEFAYVASHDLQEPLRMVASYTQLLARHYRGRLDADADEFIGYAVDGAQRMQQLIQALLVYARVGSRGGAFAPVALTPLIQAVLADLATAVAESGATVTTEPLPTVWGDATQLRQLFQNLLGNALKYRRPGVPPVVAIAATPAGAWWQFTVRDNGIGIAPADAERIFGLFQRLHSQAEFAGSGIGLAVCRRIVERHGGRIWVTSAQGNGATIHVSLPVDETAAAPGAARSAAGQAGDGAPEDHARLTP
jgi:PAS domain S-box-containing protein